MMKVASARESVTRLKCIAHLKAGAGRNHRTDHAFKEFLGFEVLPARLKFIALERSVCIAPVVNLFEHVRRRGHDAEYRIVGRLITVAQTLRNCRRGYFGE